MIWEVEPHQRELICRGDDFFSFANVKLVYGPIVVNLHDLALTGWTLHMRQRTPIHVSKTRAKIAIYPDGNRNLGFRLRLRASYPYQMPADVFYDLEAFGGESQMEMSLSKFETKEVVRTNTVVREVVREVPAVQAVDPNDLRPVLARPDPFDALREWCDERVAAIDLADLLRRDEPEPIPPDNVVNLLDFVRQRQSTDMDPELREALERALA